MDKTLTAVEAAAILDVSLPTLYSYVSRRMLQSINMENARTKRYSFDEVQRLKARKEDSRRSGQTAERAINWGLPVLESRITLIDRGKLYYRGRDMTRLAARHTLEQTAQILWGKETEDFFGSDVDGIAPETWRILMTPLAGLPPLDRAMALLPAVAPHLEHTWGRTEVELWKSGASLMRMLAAALVGGDIAATPLHLHLSKAWNAGAEAEDIVRIALVSCADHELNASTFTVRCVASTGAHLYAAVAAGLAALSGPRHGGESLRVKLFLDAVMNQADKHRYMSERMQHPQEPAGFSPSLPGFGHPLYPDGDPRCSLLLDALAGLADRLPEADSVSAVATAGEAITRMKPNLDFGLAAIERVLNLPSAAGQVIFALGRSAGWIAHAVEQTIDGNLIRPRARYVGPFAEIPAD